MVNHVPRLTPLARVIRPSCPGLKVTLRSARGTATGVATSNQVLMRSNARLCLAEGFDPDDPGVIAAIDLVRWELLLQSPLCLGK